MMFIGNHRRVAALIDHLSGIQSSGNVRVQYLKPMATSEKPGAMPEWTDMPTFMIDRPADLEDKIVQYYIDAIRSELQSLGVTLDGEAEEAAE